MIALREERASAHVAGTLCVLAGVVEQALVVEVLLDEVLGCPAPAGRFDGAEVLRGDADALFDFTLCLAHKKAF